MSANPPQYIPSSTPVVQLETGPVYMHTKPALERLQYDTSVNVDLETSGLSFKKDKIACVNLHGNDSGTTAVLHVRGRLHDEIKDFLSDKRKTFVFHNGVGFDIPFLAENGVNVWDLNYYDTMVGEAASLTQGRRDLRVSLKATGKRRTKHDVKQEMTDHGGWMDPMLTLEKVSYAARDVLSLGKIRREQYRIADADMMRALETEMKLVNVVARMKYNGVPMDVKALYTFLVSQNEKRQKLGPKLRSFFEEPLLNFNSPPQLKAAMNKMGIPVDDTKAETFEEIIKFNPLSRNAKVCQAVLDYKHAAKRISFYSPQWVKDHVIDGRVYPNWRQLGADTGRFTCNNPNLQQVPQDMRQVFGGQVGYSIIAGDYSQIEVRVAAALARDKELIRLIKTGLHIHTSLASQVFGVDYEVVTDMLKFLAKGITFLLLFGGGRTKFYLYALRGGSGLTEEQCNKIFDRFFDIFTGIWNMRLNAQTMGRSGRPVTLKMATGLKRTLIPKRFSPGKSPTVASTQILNTIVQGNAAAGIKYAMLECKKSGLDKYLSLQVHDELVLTTPDPEVRDAAEELDLAMIRGMKRIMDVPVSISMKIGSHWMK